MNEEKTVSNFSCIITVYGKGEQIEKFTVKIMEATDADFYCDTINNLKLDSGSWAFAKAVAENAQYTLADFKPLTFDLLLSLDDRAIQRVFREIDSLDLSKALRGADPKTSEKIYKNMSKRAAAMLKEEMGYMGAQPIEEIKKAQERIINTIRQLEERGEIIILKGEYL